MRSPKNEEENKEEPVDTIQAREEKLREADVVKSSDRKSGSEDDGGAHSDADTEKGARVEAAQPTSTNQSPFKASPKNEKKSFSPVRRNSNSNKSVQSKKSSASNSNSVSITSKSNILGKVSNSNNNGRNSNVQSKKSGSSSLPAAQELSHQVVKERRDSRASSVAKQSNADLADHGVEPPQEEKDEADELNKVDEHTIEHTLESQYMATEGEPEPA